ncbi:hypothetical protein L6452_14686 [Arctium lappa]|uniref:Uncharacterized protein n=1 Tax=Arctium lappa TaxID=4217 RepID=A0ACB9CLP7_ARCLA|nr:hypothetical protein L6452_14686 [Arctium lappa]
MKSKKTDEDPWRRQAMYPKIGEDDEHPFIKKEIDLDDDAEQRDFEIDQEIFTGNEIGKLHGNEIVTGKKMSK